MQIEYTIKEIVEKKVQGELKPPSVFISNTPKGYMARVMFKTSLNKTYTLFYGDVEFNFFWENFNTFGFLFEELKKKYPETKDLVIPNEIEDVVLNSVI